MIQALANDCSWPIAATDWSAAPDWLVGGKLWGAAWLDPVMGLVGAVLVTIWAWTLHGDRSDADYVK